MPTYFAQVTYTGNGSTTSYAIPFSYIDSSHVKAYINGTLTSAFTISTSTLIFTSAPANGATIRIQRETPIDVRLVDFADGSVLTEADLDRSANQSFYVAQEITDDQVNNLAVDVDDKWNAQNKTLKNLASPINDNDAVNKAFITTNLPAINTVNTNIASVATVATNIGNVNSVASNSANINSAVSNATNINAVVSNSTNINAVSTNSANINTVATNMGAVTTVANDIVKVVAVANDLAEAISEIETAADDLNEATSEIDVVASNIANVNQVGTYISNVNAVANNSTNINSVFSNSANINLVSGSIANVNIAGANISSVNDFVARYRVSGTQPTTSLDIGDLWFDSTLQKLLIYTSSGWQTASDYVSALINVYRYTATNGQTVFTGVDASGNSLSFTAQANCFVFLNGIRIVLGQDYTLTGGGTVTLTEAANTGDLLYIEVIAKISITEEAILQGYVTTAGNSATTATTQAGISTAQAVIATTQAGISTAQAVIATTQASTSTAQAVIATTQATNSASSASASATSASNSAASAASASASATAAAAAAGGGSVSVSATDTTSGKLNTKIVVSGSLTKTILNSGAAETLQLGVDVIFNETYFTATGGQTTFSTAYTPNYIQCFVNGIKLINTQDFTATNGTSVILSDACVAGDVVEFVKFK
jgi:hypothetical protein